MRCAWHELLAMLPPRIREEADRHRDTLQEIRLRIGQPPEFRCSDGCTAISGEVKQEELIFCVNIASKYSPWAAESMAKGFITSAGGHRIGLCGETVVHKDRMQGIRTPRSLCIRVARDMVGIASNIPEKCGSVLIIGPPGSGKTTLLRDLIRKLSQQSENAVAVVDERGELFPTETFLTGPRTDVLSGCGKAAGIDAVLRTMGPTHIAVDEITEETDCEALIQASYCGVVLLATAHASSLEDLHQRPVYRTLVKSGLFNTLVILRADKSYRTERMKL